MTGFTRDKWLAGLRDKCPVCDGTGRLTPEEIAQIPSTAQTFWFTCNRNLCHVERYNNDMSRFIMDGKVIVYSHIADATHYDTPMVSEKDLEANLW